MSDSVISVRDVSKAYNLYDSPRDVIKEAIFGGVRHDVFWALKNVSLEVQEGQRVGIIGPNGAGKSTLLKLITGNLQQTSGEIAVTGKVSALLSLTSFLNPDQTGLENIRFNLIVNGAQKADIPRITEEIIDFTELGAFIQAPVRTYSTGMNARLAFAISTAITPDILVIDEVLGAGDAYFAAKATMRMIELCNQGRALLFVSHAMNAVQLLCNTAIWLDGGVIRDMGNVEEIARRYEADFRRREDEALREGNQARRARLADKVVAEELARPDVSRLRLTGPRGRLADTHYVRRLVLEIDRRRLDVALDFADIDDPGVLACLDIVHSEWGRPHERRGSEARALAQGSSRLRGGHILVKSAATQSNGRRPLPFTLTVESSSIGGVEPLRAQRMDLGAGEWVDLELVERRPLSGDWEQAVFRGSLSSESDFRDAELKRIIADTQPDVEIVDVSLRVAGAEALSVRERQPFSLAVRVCANRLVERVDAIVKVLRSDGFYIFWQTSGQVGVFAEDILGEATFIFDFDPNLFGAGDYEVTVDLGNGFDIERNFPHSEIYDRRVNALKFTVAREWSVLMMGPVNYRFPVRLES